MLKKAAALGLAFALLAGPMFADECDIPRGSPHLDHFFVIVMKNHEYQQVLNNPNEPYFNSLIAGTGKDAETPAVDTWNELTLPTFPRLADIDGDKV
jgi:hypothetical protein